MEEASSYCRALFKRMLLYHWYRKGKSAREATELLCTDYGRGFVDERVVLDVYLCLDDRTNFKFDLYCMGRNLGHLDNDGIARHDEFGHHQEVPAPTYHHQYNSHQQHYYEPTSYQVPSTVNQLPSTVHQLPSTVNQLPSTVHQLPSTVNQLPSTVHQLPSTVHPILSTTELSGSQSLTFNQSVPPRYESTNVYDASTSLNTNLNPPITSTSFQSSTSHSTPSTSTISNTSTTTPRKSNNTIVESYDSNRFLPAPQLSTQPAPQPASQPLYTVERKLPPDYLYEDGSIVPRLARRHLILRCYKANYTVDQCERYLTTLNLPPICKVYKKNIQKWYKRFDREAAATISDKTKTGRPPKVSDEALEQYMVAHPRAPSLRVAQHFKLSNSTIYRRLNSLGYEPLHDRFVKKRADDPDNELSDEQLFEYKFAHPEAKAQDIGAHFNVRHMWINERLRRMGFVIPKYFKKCKPAKRRRTNLEAEEQEEGSSSSSDTDFDSDSDSNSRPTRVYPQRRPKTPGRPKGTKNIQHKGRLLHPVLGTPVTDIHEARQILRQARTLTKEERTPRLSSEPKEGIHKKEAKRADYTKDSSVAISLTEILLNAPLNIPLPPPPPKSPPNKQTPRASYSARKRKPVKPPKASIPAQPPRPIHLYKNPKFASNATQLTTTIKQEVDDDTEVITIDVDLLDNLKSESCDDTILVDDELSFDPLSNLEL